VWHEVEGVGILVIGGCDKTFLPFSRSRMLSRRTARQPGRQAFSAAGRAIIDNM
jgi:hypothetical protein